MTIFKISSSGTSPKRCTVAVGGSSEWCTENVDEYMHGIYQNDHLDEYITKVQLLRPNDLRCRRKTLPKGGDTQNLAGEKRRVDRNDLVGFVPLFTLVPKVPTTCRVVVGVGRKTQSKLTDQNFDWRFRTFDGELGGVAWQLRSPEQGETAELPRVKNGGRWWLGLVSCHRLPREEEEEGEESAREGKGKRKKKKRKEKIFLFLKQVGPTT